MVQLDAEESWAEDYAARSDNSRVVQLQLFDWASGEMGRCLERRFGNPMRASDLRRVVEHELRVDRDTYRLFEVTHRNGASFLLPQPTLSLQRWRDPCG